MATSEKGASAPSPQHLAGASGLTQMLAKSEAVEISELDKSGNVQRKWLHTEGNAIIPIRLHNQKPGFILESLRSWRKVLSDSFLPVGFPHSVTSDYLAYQTFDSLQAFFSTITSLLASRALLQGLGVGDASSSATFALLLTILKDATSRLATIAFAHRFGLAIEPDCKHYRFLADLLNDSAFFLELATPRLGGWGKVCVLATGEAGRAMCGVAAGASKAALSAHFARFDNLAELNAKEASQETAVGLFGLLAGSLVVRWVESPTTVFWLMVVLVFAHLWMNYLGVRAVVMRTFNRQRATIMFTEYLRSGRVLSPQQVSARERILTWSSTARNRHGRGVAIIGFADSYQDAVCGDGVGMLDGEMHTLFVSPPSERTKRSHIKIILWSGATPGHAMSAWFRAVEMVWLMDSAAGLSPSVRRVFSPAGSEELNYDTKFDKQELLDAMVSQGWDLSSQSFETSAPVRLNAEPHGGAKKLD